MTPLDLEDVLGSLQRGTLAHEPLEATTPEAVLQRLRDLRGDWAGIALTTRGPRALTSPVGDGLRDSGGHDLEPTEVFELRLWDTKPEPALARDLRWVAGHPGAVLTVVHDGDNSPGRPVLWRDNTYLQHHSDPAEVLDLPCVEVFTVEPVHGNTEFLDEIPAGPLGKP